MITATDPRVVALAKSWGVTPAMVIVQVCAVQATAEERGHEYEIGDLLDAALAVDGLVTEAVSTLE